MPIKHSTWISSHRCLYGCHHGYILSLVMILKILERLSSLMEECSTRSLISHTNLTVTRMLIETWTLTRTDYLGTMDDVKQNSIAGSVVKGDKCHCATFVKTEFEHYKDPSTFTLLLSQQNLTCTKYNLLAI